MNKYQKALKTFGNVPFMIGHFRVFEKSDEDVEKDYKLLQELVEKETPKKVNRKTDYYDENSEDCYTYEYCPNCHMDYDLYEYLKYCPNCGQRLEWE